MFSKIFKRLFLFMALSLFSINLHAADWTMASGYPKSNFHTQNIIKFIDEIKSTTSVNINLNPNDKSFSLDPEIFKIFLVEEIFNFFFVFLSRRFFLKETNWPISDLLISYEGFKAGNISASEVFIQISFAIGELLFIAISSNKVRSLYLLKAFISIERS